MEETWIKTDTSPQICCCITLRKISVQLNSFTSILARIISFMSGNICFMSFDLFFYSSWHWRWRLLWYFVCCVSHAFQSWRQEPQLMLTNLRDAFIGQSRLPNIAPFHMLGIVSYCAIATLSLRRAVFMIFDFKNAVTLKTGLGVRQGHWKCHHAIERI